MHPSGKPLWSCQWWAIHLVGDDITRSDAILAGTRAEAQERAEHAWPGLDVTVTGLAADPGTCWPPAARPPTQA